MHRSPLLALMLAVLFSACTTVNVTDPASVSTASSSKPAASASSAKPKADSPFKKWDEVLKDTKAMKGQFNLHMKRDRTLFMEVQPAQLGMDFGFISHYSKGTGVFNLHDGLAITDTRMMRLGSTPIQWTVELRTIPLV
ncbi:MAG: hypothetical protein O3A57_02735 [Bacteroidetes bacterium]|nr:hypothetical protein [Bacteroidota bacterium]